MSIFRMIEELLERVKDYQGSSEIRRTAKCSFPHPLCYAEGIWVIARINFENGRFP
jgi:hypothetical protein